MDLAIGAKQTFVMMDLLTKAGQSKLVAEYPNRHASSVPLVRTHVPRSDRPRQSSSHRAHLID